MSRASSASEGEVVEPQHKANTANQHSEPPINDSDRVFGLDGASDNYGYNHRARSRSPSPYRRKRTRSPSPYRQKRAIDRSPSPYRRSRAENSYDGNASHSFHKRKTSPPRGNRPDKRHHTDRDRHSDPRYRSHADDSRARQPQPGFVKERSNVADRPYAVPISYAEVENPNPVPDFRHGLKIDNRPQKLSNGDQRRDRSRQAPPQERQTSTNGSRAQIAQSSASEDVEMSSAEGVPDYTPAPAEEKVPTQESREEKRRRWAAIRAAAEQQKPKENLLQRAILTNASEATTPTIASPAPYADSPISPVASPRNGDLDSVPASPDVMIIDKQGPMSEGNSPSADSPSAADYDPMQDMLDDRDRAAKKTQNPELPSDAYRETDPKVLSTLPAEKAVPVKKQKKEFDMFAESDEETEDVAVEAEENTTAKGTVLHEKLLDNWDDPEGYYKLINNELVDSGRYRMVKNLGRGVFANVAQAEEVTADGNDQNRRLVAIKMIRRNELMRKASQKEMDFLRKVNEADPQDKRHIVRLLGSFDHKGHLCIVFEHMSKNLRDLLKEETNGHGLTLPAVRIYARQMFLGLQHLQNCQVIHLDLKPDNVLVSPDKKTIKLADFGTAVDKRDQVERTEYLVSRFYRAPEIILGMEIGYPVDMWAVGCTVYELWTGKILFTGRSNNQMVKAFMDCLGWPSEKLLKKGLVNNILDNFELGPPLKFISREVDQYNQLSVRKIEQKKKITRDMKTRVHEAARGITTQGPTVGELNDLADMLSACLHMNVEKRLSPKEALVHKFFANKSLAPKIASTAAVVKPPLLKRGTPGIRR
ncbi:dual specificity protein kinase-like protein pom1 [Cucurbitaria berberidis CBS 394.84]|uniref:non-specific serine/threonine protein kinase n=1 Tax=Cucurbitaria berberidis CBS 394.84 TaxID=1168544 RepID=A0A9P4L545_9PLEO|nr:dual specificity protein kinase-like protein pom1 [Cucurbitaria berberidis CBS 394.84]KAF1841954.1 dual specificity protein kinase-like protein pom1 [Cucurbitaria berberidis CBS 394.84]